MKHFFGILLIFGISYYSCQNNNQEQYFDWSSISAHLKDTLLFMEDYGRIPNSIEGVAAKEPKEYSKVWWLIQKTSLKDWEILLYNHPDATIKGLAAMGLARKRNRDIFKHLKYALSQDLNVHYYMTCEKLGGFFLNELNYKVPGNLEYFLTEKEIEEIEILIDGKNLFCN